MAAATTQRLLLREMTLADTTGVRRIEVAAYEDAWPQTTFEEELRNSFATYLVAVDVQGGAAVALPRPSGHAGRPWWARLLAGATPEAPPPHEAGGSIAGYCGAWFHVDQLHIVTVAVDPARQGRGIAQRLLIECFDRAIEADLRNVTLEVRPSNTRAQEIYRRFGLQQVGIHRAYYANNGEDAIVMLTPDLAAPEQRARLEVVRSEVATRFPEVDWVGTRAEGGRA
ncbi:MAG: ribosomal-protein-alanine N-acetyltransferase [Dehalococcoidia bacterium]|nr:ribosomal-protein-alanine N-acetyltransferase [Dehalococcoidia bacterium]